MGCNCDFTRTGEVIEVAPLQGSFVQVTVRGDDGRDITHTCGWCQDPHQLSWPKVGETIVVTGVIREGRHLTSYWSR